MTEQELADWLRPRGWILGIQEPMFGHGTIYRVIHVDRKTNYVRHTHQGYSLEIEHLMIKNEIMRWEAEKIL